MSSLRVACCLSRQSWLASKNGANLNRNFGGNNITRRFASSSSNKSKGTSTFKLALIGTTLGATTGTAYSLFSNWRDKKSHMEHERIPPKVIDSIPDIRITKRYVNPNDTSGLEIILFQFQTCPFCCKVRAFLDYMGMSYSVVEVNAVLRQDLKWSEQKKVPTVLIKKPDGKYVVVHDSSAIISLIASYVNDKNANIGDLANYYPTISYFDDNGAKKHDIMNKYFLMYQEKMPEGFTKEKEESERKWRTWADEHLVHLISPNCYQTYNEALDTFQWFSKAGEWDVHFPAWERNMMVYAGALAMWGIAQLKLKRRHGLSDDVRSHLYAALNKWTRELKKNNMKFMGGKKPNLADLAVFGVLSSMEGCAAFKDCLENTEIGEWFYGVKEITSKNNAYLVRERIENKVAPITNPV